MRILAALIIAAALPVLGCSGGCETVEAQIGEVCETAPIAANLQAVIDVREACGSGCAEAPGCTAILLSGALYLTLREDQCSAAACLAAPCRHDVVSCTLPALGAGDYPVIVSGGGVGSVLQVREGGVSGCHLPELPDAGT